MRVLVLVDGEHHPRVVAAAIDHLPTRVPGAEVVGAALLGGGEKLAAARPDLPTPVVTGDGPDDALAAALARFRPELVVDLSDEPVVDDRSRLRLAGRALLAGASYLAADARFDPPPRPRLAAKPSVAVIGTGKRTGKTAVSTALARALAADGRPPVIVAMGRGGPERPELVDPARDDLSATALLTRAATGAHAASDHLEGALVAGVATVGTRRCGGGLVGAPFESTFAEGLALANARPEGLLVLEGSGRAIPPAHADATVCVVPAHADPELVTGYAGAYRMLLSDVVVITMAEASLGRLSVEDVEATAPDTLRHLERGIRELVPTARVILTVFRPTPLAPISGRRIGFVTTAPAEASGLLTGHLEDEHGATVVATSHHLGHRPLLGADLEAMGDVDALVVELKAAAVDVVARFAAERGVEVVFCDNRVVPIGGDDGLDFDEASRSLADLAAARFQP